MYFCNVLNILPSHHNMAQTGSHVAFREPLNPRPPGVHTLWNPRPLSVARPGDFLLMKRMRQNGVTSFQD